MSDCNSVYIFKDIRECNNILINKGDSDFVSLLLTTEGDENLKGMDYQNFFGALYETDSMHFKIYAYDFVDSKTAKRYFKACAKRECMGNRDCCVYTDSKKFVVTALCFTRAYSLYTEPRCSIAVENYIKRAFSEEVKSVR